MLSQKRVLKPCKNSPAKSLIKPKPDLIASIMAVPIPFPPYIYILIFNIYIEKQAKIKKNNRVSLI